MNNFKDKRQKKYEKDARLKILSWFETNNIDVDISSIKVIWFAYMDQGYRCMITCVDCDDLFFEFTRNIITREITIRCYRQVEYIVYPSKSKIFSLSHSKKEIGESKCPSYLLI